MTVTSATCCQNMATGQGNTLHILVGIVWCWGMLSPFWIAEQQLVTFHSHLPISTSRNYMFFVFFRLLQVPAWSCHFACIKIWANGLKGSSVQGFFGLSGQQADGRIGTREYERCSETYEALPPSCHQSLPGTDGPSNSIRRHLI